jgi:CheY-like chemotaxis protein
MEMEDVSNLSARHPLTSFHTYESWLRLLARKPRLLIAESNPDTRYQLAKLFELAGYDLQMAADGSHLLDRLEPMILDEPDHWAPDVVLADVPMPGINPIVIVEELRQVGWDLPFVVLDSEQGRRLPERIDQIDHTAYLETPVDGRELESTIRQSIYDHASPPRV